ncbi:MAG TPA: hypothetical protein VHZ03_29085 [Trebonia sp.]|nr:hypothetical protein [Trebonia sp.]
MRHRHDPRRYSGTDRTGRASGSGRPAADRARRRAAGTADEGITGARGGAVTAPSLRGGWQDQP